MNDVELWRELGQQLRVDAIRPAAKAGSGHPTSAHVRSRPDGRAHGEVPALRLRQPARPPQRPARLLEGPRLDADVRDVPRRRRDLGGGAADLPAVRLDLRGPSDAADPVGRRRDRLARTGPPLRGRYGDRRQAARPAPVPRLDALWRQRDRRRLAVGGARARRVLRARQPRGDPRREPARPARRDDARLGSRLVREPRAGVRLPHDRDRRPRRRGDRPRLRRGDRHRGTARRDRREDDQGQGRSRRRGQERLPRQGARPLRGGDRDARRRPQPQGRRG